MSSRGTGLGKWRLTRTARWGVAAALVCLLTVVVVLVVTREQGTRAARLEDRPAPKQKIDEREGVRYVEFRAEKEKVEFRADRDFVGPDNKYHLVGNVRITDYGRKGGRELVMRCDEIIHDAERTRYALVGNVRMALEDATLVCDHMDYSRKQEVFKTDDPIDISSPRYNGSAKGLVYSMKKEEVRLLADVHLETRAGRSSGVPLVIDARTLRFRRTARRGSLEGGVTFTHGRSRGRAESVEFRLFRRTDLLDTVLLKGAVRLSLVDEFAGRADREGSGSMFRLGETQEAAAGEILLRAFLDSSRLHAFESKGGSSVSFISAERGTTRFQAESIDFIFAVDGSLREFRSFTKARMERTDTASGQTQVVEGDSMFLGGRSSGGGRKSDILRIRVKKGSKARARFQNHEVQADTLGFDVETEDLEAEGVKAVFSSSPESKAVGLFARGQPVFATSRWMRYAKAEKRFRFFGGLRMWQEKTLLLAKEVILDEETGETTGRGDVRSIFPHRRQNQAAEEQVEVRGELMRYDPEANAASYEKSAGLRTNTFRLNADTVRVFLAAESKELDKVLAEENVVILQEKREGRAGQAVYLVEDQRVEMTRNPVVKEQDRGEVQGDKLTLHLADDTIAVENITRDRSVTKIKR